MSRMRCFLRGVMSGQARDFSKLPDPVMRMRHLVPFLRMLGVGLAAAAAVFLAELLGYQIR